jgi:hypothetical protein
MHYENVTTLIVLCVMMTGGSRTTNCVESCYKRNNRDLIIVTVSIVYVLMKQFTSKAAMQQQDNKGYHGSIHNWPNDIIWYFYWPAIWVDWLMWLMSDSHQSWRLDLLRGHQMNPSHGIVRIDPQVGSYSSLTCRFWVQFCYTHIEHLIAL